MTTEEIFCAPGGDTNDEPVAAFGSARRTGLLVRDRAASVAGNGYIDRQRGDVAWFVRVVAAAPEATIATGVTQAGAVCRACRDRSGGGPIPSYAGAPAALAWTRVRPMDGQLALSRYRLGNCQAFAVDTDGGAVALDPYAKPHETALRETMHCLGLADIDATDGRRARLRIGARVRVTRGETRQRYMAVLRTGRPTTKGNTNEVV